MHLFYAFPLFVTPRSNNPPHFVSNSVGSHFSHTSLNRHLCPASLPVLSHFFFGGLCSAFLCCVGHEVHNQVSSSHFRLQTSRMILLRQVKNDPKPDKALGI
jgi:hypothetical protein